MSDQSSQALNHSKSRRKTIRKYSQVIGTKNDGVVFNYQTVEAHGIKIKSVIKLEDILSNKAVVGLFSTLIIIYTILVIIRISFETETQVYAKQLDILELAFLSIFVVEVLLRFLVYHLVTFYLGLLQIFMEHIRSNNHRSLSYRHYWILSKQQHNRKPSFQIRKSLKNIQTFPHVP